jgi:hypothetical protein
VRVYRTTRRRSGSGSIWGIRRWGRCRGGSGWLKPWQPLNSRVRRVSGGWRCRIAFSKRGLTTDRTEARSGIGAEWEACHAGLNRRNMKKEKCGLKIKPRFQCCCKCANHLPLYDGSDSFSHDMRKGWACCVVGKVYDNWPKHSVGCELYLARTGQPEWIRRRLKEIETLVHQIQAAHRRTAKSKLVFKRKGD